MNEAERAAKHLCADSLLAPIIAQHGLFRPKPHVNYYQELVSSIISQQLSVKAAATIEKRFVELFGGAFPTPELIISKDIETLRSVGLSRGKASYVIDLAQHVLDGRLEIEKLPNLSNDEIIKELVAVKGIGEWTAHMFLIFALGRLDVLPVGDLGVRTAAKKLYHLEELPTPQQLRGLADTNHWHPYESVAAWYLWQSLNNKPDDMIAV